MKTESKNAKSNASTQPRWGRGWIPSWTLALAIATAAACGGDPGGDPAAEPSEPNAVVQERLQRVLDQAVTNPEVSLPGSIVHYRNPAFAAWSGSAGWGDTEAGVAMRSDDRFRAGSIVKTFLAAVTLQHVEEGTLALGQTLPELLPAAVTDRIPNADRITLRMLLGHTSGIPEWDTVEVYLKVLDDPGHVWTPEELLDVVSGLPPMFEPGASWTYCNTNYTLLGLVLDEAAGQSWRAQVRERVLEPLGLQATSLPEPGDTSIADDFAHGYEPGEGTMLDVTHVDPSMAGPAGGGSLITTAEDLGRFLDALLAGELFSDAASLVAMTTMIDAPEESGLPHGYGLGLESYVLPDGTEVIGHGGGAPGYSTMMFRAPAYDTTIVASSNSADYFGNALEVFIPAVAVLSTDAE